MALSQNSEASIYSTRSSNGPLCHCSQPTVLKISWSDDNPGRRYYKCEDHGFLLWHDKERACLWQKQSLLEAREKILTQTEEIKALCASLRQAHGQLAALEISSSSCSVNETLKSIENCVTAHIIETEKVLRKFVRYSGGGFVLATALLVFFLKK
ncbi:unnamed protein product [Eruca vesicaria subsp. sativa]|uniref:Zinc finger GRF-type domain-containing protein n=1 Tax=Eruca vesicaria subsp. sativa TaxID=29727 RepID=A0ABC8IWS4_ERUVS|nr:unnamed protein product [Eruca vesicaria subsp. sativa]